MNHRYSLVFLLIVIPLTGINAEEATEEAPEQQETVRSPEQQTPVPDDSPDVTDSDATAPTSEREVRAIIVARWTLKADEEMARLMLTQGLSRDESLNDEQVQAKVEEKLQETVERLSGISRRWSLAFHEDGTVGSIEFTREGKRKEPSPSKAQMTWRLETQQEGLVWTWIETPKSNDETLSTQWLVESIRAEEVRLRVMKSNHPMHRPNQQMIFVRVKDDKDDKDDE